MKVAFRFVETCVYFLVEPLADTSRQSLFDFALSTLNAAVVLIECDASRQPTEDRNVVEIRSQSDEARFAFGFGFRSPNADTTAIDN